ncbi:MAG: Mpo1-like protein [Candidatus Obscuribacter sp.]|nr:DUF962 domain-containing protein [Candidatus Melainabacteria bacterium]MDX1989943.1 Mpo1-like protein [Candidatus Obscuribacter sp.]
MKIKVQGEGEALCKVKHFLVDYAHRHSHPLNALLHIIGVPLAFFGLYKILFQRGGNSAGTGAACLILGYWLQYLGHRKQGNEVGEVTLIRHLLRKIKR